MGRKGMLAVLAAALLSSACVSGVARYRASSEASQAADPGTARSDGYLGDAGSTDLEVAQEARFPAPAPLLGEAGEEGKAGQAANPSFRRWLVYSGEITLAAGDVAHALDLARAMAEELGGYFQSLEDNRITLRVPADRWEEALSRLPTLGRVVRRRIEAADVTDEVVDLGLRLKNARALLDRLTELLAKAQSVEETLAVEKELNRVRTLVEGLEGKLDVLKHRVAYSTLVLVFVPAESAPKRAQALPFPWLRELGLEHLLSRSGGVR